MVVANRLHPVDYQPVGPESLPRLETKMLVGDATVIEDRDFAGWAIVDDRCADEAQKVSLSFVVALVGQRAGIEGCCYRSTEVMRWLVGHLLLSACMYRTSS